MNLQSKQIIVDDMLINYIEANPEASQAFVFLHGWQSQANVWLSVIQKFSRPVRIVAVDLPGFGKSPTPQTVWGVGEYANLVKKLLAKLDIYQPVLVGHSFGGRVSIKLAAQNPDLIKHLVLADAAGFRDDSAGKKLKIFTAKLLRPLFNLPGLEKLRPKIYKLIGAADYAESGALKHIFVKVINEDLSSDMEKIKNPTLLVWGETDLDTPVESGARMNRLIAGSQLVVLPGAGHFSFLNKTDKFVELIENLS